MSIKVQIRNSHDSPTGLRPAQRFGADDSIAVAPRHVPHGRNIGAILLPDQIRMSITIQIRDPYDPPTGLWSPQDLAAEDGAAVVGPSHVPGSWSIGAILLPVQIRHTIPVEIPDDGNLRPATARRAQQKGVEPTI